MKSDPPVRQDGTCRVCKGERPEPAVLAGDPFCDHECCKRWHGVVVKTHNNDGRKLPSKETTKKQAAARKKKNPGANFEIRGKRSARVNP